MKNLRWISLCVFIIFSAQNTFSQNVEFKVIDSHTEKVLSGVKIEPVCIDRTAYTSSSGKSTLNLDIDYCCNVKITKLGYAPETVEVCPEDKRVELYFFRNFNIKGAIKSPAGVALNRARIEFGSECGDGMRVAYTDAAGRFTFTPPAIGACCYEMIISHPDHRKNTAVFCTTDEVNDKDIRIDYKVSDVEDFTIADVSYTTKTISTPSEKPIVTTAAYQYVTTSNPNSASSSPPTISSTTPYVSTSAPQYISTTAPAPPEPTTYNTPEYSTSTYYISETTYTPPPTYTPTTPSSSAPQLINSSTRNKFIDPTDLSLNDVTPISANLTYFDVNQSAIRSDAYVRLDNVASFMQSNPDLAVEIAVHCDSRGDYGYNQNLSERRARAVADYLVSKGVSKNRLIVQGYGESQLINHCRDGIPCSEMEHRQNRRALFRVTGSIYDADYTASRTYETYQPPVYAPSAVRSPQSTVTNPAPTVPTPGVPCPDCPVKELDNEEYMDKLHREEYFDDNFYDSDDGNN